MKKSDYPKSILATFDYMVEKLFLSDEDRNRMLNGYKPGVDKFGPAPKDPEGYYVFLQYCEHYTRNVEIANKDIVDNMIRQSVMDWPSPNPSFRLRILTIDQLFVLNRRIAKARSALECSGLPCKESLAPDKDKDTFFPALCLYYLLNSHYCPGPFLC